MAESIASLRRVSMTGSITWNSKKQGVDQADIVCIDILNFYLDLRYDIRKITLILKRQIDIGWFIKMFLNQKRLPERYESILPALKNGTPIRLNTIKLPEKNRGKN